MPPKTSKLRAAPPPGPGTRRPPPAALAVSASLCLQQGGHLLGGADRIALLEAIHATGSMNQAARVAGISYVTALDRIRDMNNATGRPLVHRTTGGSGGGGTVLTPYALELISAFRQIEQVHGHLLQQLSTSLANPGEVLSTLANLGLRTSARNQLAGVVTQVQAGAIDALVTLQLPGAAASEAADTLRVALTTASLKTLGVRKGMQALALIKAPSVDLAGPGPAADPGHHNHLPGRVTAIRPGRLHAEVQVRLKGGQTVVSRTASARVRELQLVEGAAVQARFPDHAVILGVV